MFPICFTVFAALLFASSVVIDAQPKMPTNEETPIEFTGTLETGKRYIANITHDGASQSYQPAERLKVPMHHAGTIEWTNLAETGVYYTLSISRQIAFVFEVVSHESSMRSAQSWRTTYFCRIVEIKTVDENRMNRDYKAFIFAGKCLSASPTGKRHQSYVFTFKILRVLAGEQYIAREHSVGYSGKEITFERFAGLGGNDLLKKINRHLGEPFSLDTEKEVEITVLIPVDLSDNS